MFAFVVVLAALVVGDGPEAVSPKVNQRFDLRGKWKGVWLDETGVEWEATAENGTVFGERPEFVKMIKAEDITDEGSGRVRVLYPRVNPPALGIYQWQADCLIICFRVARFGRPERLRGGNGQDLITLRRVKPAK